MPFKPFALAVFAIVAATNATAACSPSDAAVTISRWYDEQNLKMYYFAVGELVNNCAEPIGIEVRFIGRDKAGNLIDTKQAWPASIQNIPPRTRQPFKLSVFAYNKDIKTMSAEVASVKRWP